MTTLTAALAVACGALLAAGSGHAADVADAPRRQQFQQAYQAGLNGDAERFESLAPGLRDYILYPYLEYARLKGRLEEASAAEVRTFLDHYAATPLDWRLRSAWLRELARRGDWTRFMAFYRPTDDTTLRCQHGVARLHSKRLAGLAEDAMALWQVGRSQPDACDPLFKWLYQSGHIDAAAQFERTALALEAGQASLAAWLAEDLHGERRIWYERWRRMIRAPAETLDAAASWQDSAAARRIVRHGLGLVAGRDDGGQAWAHWRSVADALSFSAAERGAIIRKLALDAATDYHPESQARLDAVPASHVNASVRAWRVRVWLQRRDWRRVLGAIEALPEGERQTPRWRYWRARALQAGGEPQRARSLYEGLADDASYYGFLAADRLGRGYALTAEPLAPDPGAQAALAARPAMARALELFHVDMLLEARREWQLALDDADTEAWRQAALLAIRHGWFDRAIVALAGSGDWRAFEQRFPLAFAELIRDRARRHKLDPAWVYGLVRAESGFVSDAHSPAGARGLMQIMPGTGRDLARELGLAWHGAATLSDAALNIRLGTRYLADLRERYLGNPVLATAAYNAGPHQVDRWIQENSPRFPEIWAETIPFYETRAYIQRVLAYTAIYDWRLGGDITRLRERMYTPALARTAD